MANGSITKPAPTSKRSPGGTRRRRRSDARPLAGPNKRRTLGTINLPTQGGVLWRVLRQCRAMLDELSTVPACRRDADVRRFRHRDEQFGPAFNADALPRNHTVGGGVTPWRANRFISPGSFRKLWRKRGACWAVPIQPPGQADLFVSLARELGAPPSIT